MVLNIINQMWSTVRKNLIDNSIIKTCKKIYLYNCRLSRMIRGRRSQYCQKCVICLSFEGMIFFYILQFIENYSTGKACC